MLDEKRNILVTITASMNKQDYKYSYKDGKFNIYILFTDEQNMCDGKLRIRDGNTEEEKSFVLPDCKCSDYYVDKNGKEIWISPISIYFKDTYGKDIRSLTLVLKNGKRYEMMENNRICKGGITGGSAGDQSFVWFSGYYNYKNIDYIELNGEKIEKKN